MAELLNVEIFAVGTWNGMKFVSDDLAEIAENTQSLMEKGRLKPPLKLGHSEAQILKGQSDGDPALGWLDKIRVSEDGSKLLANFVAVPQVVFEAVQKELYKNVSVEMRHIDHTGWVMTGLALLGAELPAIKTLDELQAFLSDINAGAPCDLNEGQLLTFTDPLIIEKEIMADEKTVDFADERAKFQEEINKLKADKDALMKEQKEVQFSAEKETLLADYKQDVKDGKLSPAAFSKLELHLEGQKAVFLDGAKIAIEPKLMREIMIGYSETLPSTEMASDVPSETADAGADELLEKEIAVCMTKTGKNYSDASQLVFMSNPELLENYKQETLKIH